MGARGKQQVSDFVSDGSTEQGSQVTVGAEARDRFDPRKEDVRAIRVGAPLGK